MRTDTATRADELPAVGRRVRFRRERPASTGGDGRALLG
jgi:hypothetical protein